LTFSGGPETARERPLEAPAHPDHRR
jgi:hypothetical protein